MMQCVQLHFGEWSKKYYSFKKACRSSIEHPQPIPNTTLVWPALTEAEISTSLKGCICI